MPPLSPEVRIVLSAVGIAAAFGLAAMGWWAGQIVGTAIGRYVFRKFSETLDGCARDMR